MRVVHFITRLIIGGAQENTLLTVEDQHRDYQDEVTLITGPGLGPEGSLEERAKSGGLDMRMLPGLRRNIAPWKDWASYRELVRMLKDIKPDIVHTHSSKAGIMGRAAAWKLNIPCVHTIHGASFHPYQNAMVNRVYIALERWAAKRSRAARFRRRCHDRPLSQSQGGPAGAVHHHLQRHGSGTVSQSAQAPRKRPAGIGFSARRHRGGQSGQAVSSERPRGRDRRRENDLSGESPRQIPVRGRWPPAGAIRKRDFECRFDESVRVHGPSSAGAGSGTFGGDGYRGPCQSEGRFGPGVAAGSHFRKADHHL